MKNNCTMGHLASLLTIVIWGTTFISTKVLLTDFQPVEILFFRFIMGLIALLLIYPRRCSCLALGWSSPGLQTRSTCSTSFS